MLSRPSKPVPGVSFMHGRCRVQNIKVDAYSSTQMMAFDDRTVHIGRRLTSLWLNLISG